ncbi:peptidoglycan-associated lipoprotein Pal [Pseudovibrio sp. Tun.PSC04-5.I4]|uniref:peptidoglycan-associated lipoprotein Pal n=1 Tax=Pseudovibrio sp. Tun.PSC04-5.I4 TaxID=1798213 RepID=UPI000890EB43|nr:peptidoglycan-associated lipoprotein Pal [Pseudovibrio sp. Tun.PSC04-5.I4]SDR32896.1 peptidoglycan-associated lipoprotein [Pseudovibrio sp. Tun.PSC04-5.I4]
MSKTLFARGARFAAVVGVCLVAAACSQTRPELTANSSVVAGSGQDFVVNVGDRVFFLNNQSSIDGASRGVLDKQARWLQSYGKYSITIEGHADERGTRQYNIALGARRASAVREYLVAKGISPTRIKTISYGKERPIAVCNANSCWSQNRRAVTLISGQ